MALVGAGVNAKGYIGGFYIWLVSDAMLALLSLYQGLYGMFVLFAVYLLLAAYGIYEWKKKGIYFQPYQQRSRSRAPR